MQRSTGAHTGVDRAGPAFAAMAAVAHSAERGHGKRKAKMFDAHHAGLKSCRCHVGPFQRVGEDVGDKTEGQAVRACQAVFDVPEGKDDGNRSERLFAHQRDAIIGRVHDRGRVEAADIADPLAPVSTSVPLSCVGNQLFCRRHVTGMPKWSFWVPSFSPSPTLTVSKAETSSERKRSRIPPG